MFELPIMLFIIVIMTIIHISLWQIFPDKIRDIFMANPILAFIIDLCGSVLIETFTGVASIVGVCNLAASVFFGGYAYWYGKHRGIKGIGLGAYKLFNWLPICPRLMVVYEKDGKTWRA